MMAMNSNLQVQFIKARAQYGAAHAEKDIKLECITSAEAERDQLCIKVDKIQTGGHIMCNGCGHLAGTHDRA